MKYPSGVKKTHQSRASHIQKKNKITYGARGMTLEKDLDQANRHYIEVGRAVIHKKPTPVQIVNVDYPSRKKAKITEAYFKVPSTSDYNGIYKGKYIDFEAKETKNKTLFPFINIHAHQVEHMHVCQKAGGIVFLIIKFISFEETFLMPFDKFYTYWYQFNEKNGRKSIRYVDIKEDSILIKNGYKPRLNYLDAVDAYYF